MLCFALKHVVRSGDPLVVAGRGTVRCRAPRPDVSFDGVVNRDQLIDLVAGEIDRGVERTPSGSG